MPLLERYLRAVEFWLPEEGRADIVAELAEDIQSEVEDREAELGRSLQEDELADVLRAHGHPMLVAERYRPSRSLIGPGLFPLYLFTLKVVLLWILLPLAIGSAILSAMVGPHPAGELLDSLGGVWSGGWHAVVGITILFALGDRLGVKARLFRGFDPRRLPERPAARDQDHLSGRVSGLVGDVVLAAWAVAALGTGLVFRAGGLTVTTTPAWRLLFWPALVFALAWVILGIADLVRPSGGRGRLLLRLATTALGLLLVGLLLAAAPGVALHGSRAVAPALVMPGLWLNLSLNLVVAAGGLFLLVTLARRAWALWRSARADVQAGAVTFS